VCRLAPDHIKINIYGGLGDLPFFSPDLEEAEPPSVTDFRAQLQAVDGVLIASPEYAHGISGVLKNALDWLVGTGELAGKPVALLNASPRATHGQAALVETLTVMEARIATEASVAVHLAGKGLDDAGIASHPQISKVLYDAILAFAWEIETTPADATWKKMLSAD
jgi:NAD(P)H-dependent FMN reductase